MYPTRDDDEPGLGVKSPPYLLSATDSLTFHKVIYTVACISDEFEAEIGKGVY